MISPFLHLFPGQRFLLFSIIDVVFSIPFSVKQDIIRIVFLQPAAPVF